MSKNIPTIHRRRDLTVSIDKPVEMLIPDIEAQRYKEAAETLGIFSVTTSVEAGGKYQVETTIRDSQGKKVPHVFTDQTVPEGSQVVVVECTDGRPIGDLSELYSELDQR